MNRSTLLASLVLALLPTPGEVASAASIVRSYPAPTSPDELERWKPFGPGTASWLTQVPGDPCSPRVRLISSEEVSARAAVLDLARTKRVTFAGTPQITLEPLEAWRGFDGQDRRVGLIATRLCGQPGVLFVQTQRQKDGTHYVVGREMTRATYEAWGGVARMMVLDESVPSVNVFPAQRRQQIVTAPLPRQVALYEAALDKLYSNIAGAMTMMAQAEVTRMMTQLNYNLLFGNDITNTLPK
ncbi:hypothetical protein DAETH_24270 [Deinococcus aetherius]|uniref:Uncharacterized protein n=1 Tax=Deinococcus aetherius TaxID=200252 RepID=A0ABM8AF75_9DEIO|nr:hypothetical protein [Deinococcus aetherius]BDP42458.1 hypothetical protein DAETH_24270 [Deinococcus aetherius]